ncbi:hypothetical protein GCM10027343_14040 [Noviherbaspirillum agri]
MTIRLPDFDVLAALHRQDPEALETFRKHVLREAVDSAPPVHRPSLEQLLTQIESAREAAETPIEAATVAFRMMCDSVERLQHGWEQALDAVADLQAAVIIERVRARSAFPADGRA